MASNVAVVCRSQATQPVADPHLGDDREGCHQPCQAQGKGCRVQRHAPFWCCFGQGVPQWGPSSTHCGTPHEPPGGDLCVGHICALPGREDSPDLQEVCLALHNLGKGSLGARGFGFLEDPAKAAPSAGAPGVHCAESWLPSGILDVYG